MTTVELLSGAITASALSQRQFALQVLGVDERTVRKWMNGDREIPPNVRIICRAITARPGLAGDLITAHAELMEACLV